MNNHRACIARIVHQVVQQQSNLDDALAKYLPKVDKQQHSFVKAASFGSLRFYHRLKYLLNSLLDKPIQKKESLVETLLITGLHECLYMHTPQHACVSETVNASLVLKKAWAKGLCNAILRKALREKSALASRVTTHPEAHHSHPPWLIDALTKQYPDQYLTLLTANNDMAPLTLRVNRTRTDRNQFIKILSENGIAATPTRHSTDGVRIASATDVTGLPGFTAGWFSVQDEAAQLAAGLLNPQNGERILDACAAPGGKTTHLLELAPKCELTALDTATGRLDKVADNLQRLGLHARIQTGDATTPSTWWDKRAFDRILLDAPCSATGVIRRHPDIKLLRRPRDLTALTQTQSQILASLWPLLKTGGMLLYSTCSVLTEENGKQIQQFIGRQDDAECRPINATWGHDDGYGRQILPGEDGMDGFYYSLIYKCNA